MTKITRINPSYSTTRTVTRQQPVIEKQAEDKFEAVLFLPEGEARQGEGGLRTQGYFKTSLESKPLITVVTVVFNGEQFLEETIQSVINQTYDNIEYIIIDGGSTDGTLGIIRKYEHAIDYWVSEKDNGIYDAMNKGCVLAVGEGLVFLNAGDYYVGNVFTGLMAIPSMLPCRIKDKLGNIKPLIIKDTNGGMPTSHQAILFRNKKKLYNVQYKIAADYDFFIRHNNEDDFNIDKINDGYVVYDNCGVSSSNYWLRDREIFHIIRNYFGFIHACRFYFVSLIKSLVKFLIK
jgi:glycosyltransferase involved in cell wall biosynthesis